MKNNENDLKRPTVFPDFTIEPNGTLAHDAPLSSVLAENRRMLNDVFSKDGTFICRDFSSERVGYAACFAVYFDGLINNTVVYESVLRPIITISRPARGIEDLARNVVVNVETRTVSTASECFEAMLSGDSVVFLEGSDRALVASTKGFAVRSPTEPEGEKALLGPREGFTESVLTNVTMVHRKLKTVDFRAEAMTFGTRSATRAFLCYLDSVAHPDVVRTVKERLSNIVMDGILDANYIAEQISDSKSPLFRTVGITERPDAVAAGLLEGRIVLLLDGTPVALEMPHIFLETFQVSEDYYQSFALASVSRFLRFLCFFLTILVPGVFVSLVSYHWELLPTDLALSIASARVGVPFPIAVECLLMIVVFEIIREASQRLPGNIAQALSIVGAIVIGDAAVSARFIGSTTLIVVAFAGITGLISPRLQNSVVILRVLVLISGALLGLYGVFFASVAIALHLMTLESFGVPYTSYLFSPHAQDQKDVLIRAPWYAMRTRPNRFARDSVRMEK